MIDRVNLMEFLRLVSWVLCAFVCVFVMVNALQFFSHRWPRLLQWHSRWIGWSDSDNDLEAIRQVLPTPSEIRQMSDDDALTWLRTLLPDNILSDQLESVSHTFILIPKMFLNFLSEELQYLSNVSWQSLETRTTRLDPRSSILKTRILRVSSLESSPSSFKSSRSSFESSWSSFESSWSSFESSRSSFESRRQRIYRLINFSKYSVRVHVNLVGLLSESEKFSESRL